MFFTQVPPQINKNDIPGEGLVPKEVKIKINSTLTLECVAQAFPTPALLWYKDGQVEVNSICLHFAVYICRRFFLKGFFFHRFCRLMTTCPSQPMAVLFRSSMRRCRTRAATPVWPQILLERMRRTLM